MSKYILFLLFGVIFSGCAKMATLTGGPEDSYAPVLDSVKVYPPNYSTHYSSKGIILEFDEYFKLDLTKNISINPGITKAPKFKVKGKRLFIELASDLDENTTYSINFGNSIKDITEGNVLKNFKYVFSTGSFIDSLECKGKVIIAEKGIPIEGAMVGLYLDLSDSVPYLSQPNYVGITDEFGLFYISNVKEGSYKMVALSDEDGNYQYNEQTESIGFHDQPIDIKPLDSTALMIEFHTFQALDKKRKYLDKTGYKDGIAKINFNQPIEEPFIEFIQPEDIEETLWTPHRDSLMVYTQFPKQKLELVLIQDDGSRDTIVIRLNEDLPPLKMSQYPKGFYHANDIVISFNNVISEFFEEDIHLTKDSSQIPITLLIDQQSPNRMIIKGNYKVNTEYMVHFDSSSVIDIAGRPFDSTSIKVHTYKENYFGSIGLGIVTNNMENMFLQLTDLKKNVVRTSDSFYGAETIEFDQLKPGKYLARLVFDKNFNNKWDTGNYLNQLQPERVLNYKTVIEIRSNWNMNEDWSIDQE
ncbi:MAG: Ig-like domain-containing protein [Flavobacteriales bacterium]|nr:Ig-like domain-containing protein [Flavobacteriales bacterium]